MPSIIENQKKKKKTEIPMVCVIRKKCYVGRNLVAISLDVVYKITVGVHIVSPPK